MMSINIGIELVTMIDIRLVFGIYKQIYKNIIGLLNFNCQILLNYFMTSTYK